VKILVIKTSSLGDVFHTLPAIEDAARYCPGICIDWVVEEGFADIPAWHPAVRHVIPVAWRRWRKNLFSKQNRSEMRAFRRHIREEQYDLVLDAQGLIKSSLIARMAHGTRVGLDASSCREPFAARAYERTITVARGEHAIHRLRRLFALALDYPLTERFGYGLEKNRWQHPDVKGDYWLFLHGTTWDTKLWPEAYWRQLAEMVSSSGRQVFLPWGNEEERLRAERIAADLPFARVLPRMSLNSLAAWLAHAQAVVGVDTGLSHVAAALEVPSVAIYGSTDARLTGALGPQMQVLTSQYACAPCLSRQCLKKDSGSIQPPCYREISPVLVYEHLQQRLC
jgi:heptosyltransferase I